MPAHFAPVQWALSTTAHPRGSPPEPGGPQQTQLADYPWLSFLFPGGITFTRLSGPRPCLKFCKEPSPSIGACLGHPWPWGGITPCCEATLGGVGSRPQARRCRSSPSPRSVKTENISRHR